jgi:hypothetical protein
VARGHISVLRNTETIDGFMKQMKHDRMIYAK